MPGGRHWSAATARFRSLGVVEDASPRKDWYRTRARTALLLERDSMTARVSFRFQCGSSRSSSGGGGGGGGG